MKQQMKGNKRSVGGRWGWGSNRLGGHAVGGDRGLAGTLAPFESTREIDKISNTMAKRGGKSIGKVRPRSTKIPRILFASTTLTRRSRKKKRRGEMRAVTQKKETTPAAIQKQGAGTGIMGLDASHVIRRKCQQRRQVLKKSSIGIVQESGVSHGSPDIR